jgi:hypothetical protein
MASLDQPVGDWVAVPVDDDRGIMRGMTSEYTGPVNKKTCRAIGRRKNVDMADNHVLFSRLRIECKAEVGVVIFW